MSGDGPIDREALERLNADDLPQLAAFLGGYLHEDWQLGFASAAEAAYAFVGGADLDDVEELAADWTVLMDATHDLDLAGVNLLLRERFRSAWHLTAKSELQAVAHELDRALRE